MDKHNRTDLTKDPNLFHSNTTFMLMTCTHAAAGRDHFVVLLHGQKTLGRKCRQKQMQKGDDEDEEEGALQLSSATVI